MNDHEPTCIECDETHEDGAYAAVCERHEGCTESASCGSSIIYHEPRR